MNGGQNMEKKHEDLIEMLAQMAELMERWKQPLDQILLQHAEHMKAKSFGEAEAWAQVVASKYAEVLRDAILVIQSEER